jgi:hypothetical protein
MFGWAASDSMSKFLESGELGPNPRKVLAESTIIQRTTDKAQTKSAFLIVVKVCGEIFGDP